MKITEENFVQLLRQRNEDALGFAAKNYGGIMKTVINRILYLYPQDAEECLYDSILKIWEKIECFDETKNSFKSWAAAVAKYTALDRLRKITRLEPAVDIDELPIADAVHITDNQLFNEFFMELISCLNDEDKKLFIRLFWIGDTIDEAAIELGKRKSSIYNRISRGKKKIISSNPQFFRRRSKYE